MKVKKNLVDELYLASDDYYESIHRMLEAKKHKRPLKKLVRQYSNKCFDLSEKIDEDASMWLRELFFDIVRKDIPIENVYKILELMGFEIVAE